MSSSGVTTPRRNSAGSISLPQSSASGSGSSGRPATAMEAMRLAAIEARQQKAEQKAEREAEEAAASAPAAPSKSDGFVIPSIRLTPPNSRPHASSPIPEQDLGREWLYVPVRTEEIGWEEGGIYWAGRYAYPIVNLYGGDDDHIIGTYRGGPKGYGFVDIVDPAFSVAPQDESSPPPPTPSRSSSNGGKAKAKSPVATVATPTAEKEDPFAGLSTSTAFSSKSSASTASSAGNDGEVPSGSGFKPLATPSRRGSEVSDASSSVFSPVSSAVSSPATTPPTSPIPSDCEECSDAEAHAGRPSELAKNLSKATSASLNTTFTLSMDGPNEASKWPAGRSASRYEAGARDDGLCHQEQRLAEASEEQPSSHVSTA